MKKRMSALLMTLVLAGNLMPATIVAEDNVEDQAVIAAQVAAEEEAARQAAEEAARKADEEEAVRKAAEEEAAVAAVSEEPSAEPVE